MTLKNPIIYYNDYCLWMYPNPLWSRHKEEVCQFLFNCSSSKIVKVTWNFHRQLVVSFHATLHCLGQLESNIIGRNFYCHGMLVGLIATKNLRWCKREMGLILSENNYCLQWNTSYSTTNMTVTTQCFKLMIGLFLSRNYIKINICLKESGGKIFYETNTAISLLNFAPLLKDLLTCMVGCRPCLDFLFSNWLVSVWFCPPAQVIFWTSSTRSGQQVKLQWFYMNRHETLTTLPLDMRKKSFLINRAKNI